MTPTTKHPLQRHTPPSAPLFSIKQCLIAGFIGGPYTMCTMIAANLNAINYRRGALIGAPFAVFGLLGESLLAILCAAVVRFGFGLRNPWVLSACILAARILCTLVGYLMVRYCFDYRLAKPQPVAFKLWAYALATIGFGASTAFFQLLILQSLSYLFLHHSAQSFALLFVLNVAGLCGTLWAISLAVMRHLYKAVDTKLVLYILVPSALLFVASFFYIVVPVYANS